MGGGKQKKQDRRSKKPLVSASKAIKRMGGSIKLAKGEKPEEAGEPGEQR